MDESLSAGRILDVLPLTNPPAAAVAEAQHRQRVMAGKGGPLQLIFEDVSGARLVAHTLSDIDPPPHEGRDASQTYTELFELPAATKGISLQTGSARLAERRASQSLPIVEFTSPAGAGTLTTPLAIEWRASDADGDNLRFSLLYSADDGATWRVLATNLPDRGVRLPNLDMLPGGEKGRFRVIASDGFNVSEATTPFSFSVPNTKPKAAILGPANGSKFKPGQTVVFLGAAMDLEDKSVSPSGLGWTSSLDGAFAQGSEAQTRSLKSGRHTITLGAKDSAGARSEATIEIVIEDSGGPTLPNDREHKQIERLLNGNGGNGGTLLVVGGAAGTLIIVLLGGLLFKSRHAKKRASAP